MLDQPKIHPSSDADWKRYYEKKYNETDKQLKEVAWAITHMLRFVMEEKKEDAILLGLRVARKLTYPRDKDPLIAEIVKHPEYRRGILRAKLGEDLGEEKDG